MKITLKNGTVYDWVDYLGAADGFMYIRTEDGEVIRIEQRKIDNINGEDKR